MWEIGQFQGEAQWTNLPHTCLPMQNFKLFGPAGTEQIVRSGSKWSSCSFLVSRCQTVTVRLVPSMEIYM